MKQHKHTNSLIRETSPYLLQHAHNPVKWMPWSNEAMEKAQKEGKLMLISIGYSACHWCHVMEHESFENEEVADLMNENYVCIKVDREERPDVDQLYMSAVQLMTKRGGWPLNAVALPDGKPFWGGTYFPKEDWMSVLKQISDLYRRDPKKVEDYANHLSDGIRESAFTYNASERSEITERFIKTGVNNWKDLLDYEWGGNAGAPKFMLPTNLQFLFEYAYLHKDKRLDKYVVNTLEKLALGGIYDQVGGGFARYATDKKWKVPHFEKMLYDNAQLIAFYSQAFRKDKTPLFKQIAYQSIAFVKRELMSPEFVFYSALDADSEGEEGKFYVWNKDELLRLLGNDFHLFSAVYNSIKEECWEQGNYILHRTQTDEEVAREHKMDLHDLQEKIKGWQDVLLKERSKRIPPGLDDKSLTSWNAMMGEALLDAYLSFDEPEFLDLAIKNARAIQALMTDDKGNLYHSYKNGTRKIEGFLEDYASTVSFYLRLFEASTDQFWLQRAESLTLKTIEKFSGEDQILFWFSEDGKGLPVTRQKEVYDNVIPSSNSVMAHNLFKLSYLIGNKDYQIRSEKMMVQALNNFHQYPSGYSNWARLALYHQQYFEIAVVGEDAQDLILGLSKDYHPNLLYCGSDSESLYLTKERRVPGKTLIYVCVNNTCSLPLENVADAKEILQ